MAKRSLTVTLVTDAAIELVDRDGLGALSLSAVAELLAVRPSALYTHVDGLDGLRHLVAISATHGLIRDVRMAAIGVAGRAALDATGIAYRTYALDHPGLYQATVMPPRLAADHLAEANAELLDVFRLVYRGVGLDIEKSFRAARCTRTAIHGFVTLEIATGSSHEHDQHFRELIETMCSGLF